MPHVNDRTDDSWMKNFPRFPCTPCLFLSPLFRPCRIIFPEINPMAKPVVVVFAYAELMPFGNNTFRNRTLTPVKSQYKGRQAGRSSLAVGFREAFAVFLKNAGANKQFSSPILLGKRCLHGLIHGLLPSLDLLLVAHLLPLS